MDNFEFRFRILGAPDAKAFTFYDITGDYHEHSNPKGWGSPNIARSDITDAKIEVRRFAHDSLYKHTYHLNTETINEWDQGVEFPISSDDPWDTIFEDDAYRFLITLTTTSGTCTSRRDFGFYALIKEAIMMESLTYRPNFDKLRRDTFWEKIRLLDNLFISTETEQIRHFQDNLNRLKDLQNAV